MQIFPKSILPAFAVGLLILGASGSAMAHDSAPIGVEKYLPLLGAVLAACVALYLGNRAFNLNLKAFEKAAEAQDRATEERNVAQTWRRREFVADWFERLRADTLAQTAMLALDQTDVRLRINAPVDWPGGRLPARFSAKDSEQLVRVYSDMTFMSLVPHDLLAPEVIYFTEEQMLLKRCFDELFSRLNELNSMVVAKLVEFSDIKPYIDYWVTLLSGGRRSVDGVTQSQSAEREQVFLALKLFLHAYGYSGVIALAKHFGDDLDLNPTPIDRKKVIAAVQTAIAKKAPAGGNAESV